MMSMLCFIKLNLNKLEFYDYHDEDDYYLL